MFKQPIKVEVRSGRNTVEAAVALSANRKYHAIDVMGVN
jgi:hypothetical protein